MSLEVHRFIAFICVYLSALWGRVGRSRAMFAPTLFLCIMRLFVNYRGKKLGCQEKEDVYIGNASVEGAGCRFGRRVIISNSLFVNFGRFQGFFIGFVKIEEVKF
jgi:hypothetical protein